MVKAKPGSLDGAVARPYLSVFAVVMVALGGATARADPTPADPPVLVAVPPPGCRPIGIAKGVHANTSPTAAEAEVEVLREGRKMGATHLVTWPKWTAKTGPFVQRHTAFAFRCVRHSPDRPVSTVGTAQEARAMLDRAVEALRRDPAKALAAFQDGWDGFEDRDLFVFCIDSNREFSAHPRLRGESGDELRDPDGKPVGRELLASVRDGQVVEVTYKLKEDGRAAPVAKVGLVTRASGQVCVVSRTAESG